MAGRPPKDGIDYSNWNVDIFDNDPKIDKLLDAQAWSGFGIYMYLCQKAYGSNGYYYKWDYSDSATTARKMGGGIKSDTVIQTVNFCLRIGLFDKGLFDREKILTSRGIQIRFRQVALTRSCKRVNKKYWLLSPEESKGLDLYDENTNFEGEKNNYDPSKLNYDPSKSNYENKRKGEESIEKESTENNPPSPLTPSAAKKAELKKVWEKYTFNPDLDKKVREWLKYKREKNQSYKPTGLNSLLCQITKHAQQHGDNTVIELIDECMANNWKGIIWDKISDTKANTYTPKLQNVSTGTGIGKLLQEKQQTQG